MICSDGHGLGWRTAGRHRTGRGGRPDPRRVGRAGHSVRRLGVPPARLGRGMVASLRPGTAGADHHAASGAPVRPAAPGPPGRTVVVADELAHAPLRSPCRRCGRRCRARRPPAGVEAPRGLALVRRPGRGGHARMAGRGVIAWIPAPDPHLASFPIHPHRGNVGRLPGAAVAGHPQGHRTVAATTR